MTDAPSATRATFTELRHAAMTDPLIAACIGLRCMEFRALDWDVVATPGIRRDVTGQRAEAIRRARQPDPNYRSLASWLGTVARELLSTGAVVLHPTKTRGGDRDATWLLGTAGVLPVPYGDGIAGCLHYLDPVPRCTIRETQHLPLGAPVDLCAPGDLHYLTFERLPDSLFGASPVEDAIGKDPEDILRAFAVTPARLGIDIDGVSADEDAAWLRARLDWLEEVVMPVVIADADLAWKWIHD